MMDNMSSVKFIHESRKKSVSESRHDSSSHSKAEIEPFLQNDRNKAAIKIHKTLQQRREELAKPLKNQDLRTFMRCQAFVLANLITRANLMEVLREEHTAVQELKLHLDEFLTLVDAYLTSLETLVCTEERLLETPEGEFLLEKRVEAVLHNFDSIQEKSKNSPWKTLIQNCQVEVEDCDKKLGKLEKTFLGVGAGGSVIGLTGIGLAIAFSPFTAGLTLFAAVPSVGLMISSGVLSGVSIASFLTGALCYKTKRKNLRDILESLTLLEEALDKELQKWLKELSSDVCGNIPEELGGVFEKLALHRNRICNICLDIPGGWENVDGDPDAVLVDYPDSDVEEIYCRKCVTPFIQANGLSPVTRKAVTPNMLRRERTLNGEIRRLKQTFKAALNGLNARLEFQATPSFSTSSSTSISSTSQ